MRDLFTPADPLRETYSRVYEALAELREGFHRSGRLDDSNAKLDEVSKLFATYLAHRNGQIHKFPMADSPALVRELQVAFAATARLPQYQLEGGASIFGSQPSLALRSGDETLARHLVRLVRDSVDLAFTLRSAGRPFDVLNEAFGHFVRDNFRSNVEDAQFMTPPEVVDFMVDVVLRDIAEEDPAAADSGKHWTVVDPTCGVGSFLAVVYQRARQGRDWLSPKRLRLIGQDKVERMVRLSRINLDLFDVEEHRITLGNSLETGSALDELNGTVDVILTNPPFGARFEPSYVASRCRDNLPFFGGLRKAPPTIDSELLFVDRNLRLLREGGRLLMVVPDGVVSARGVRALLRQHIARVATIRAVIELPSVTFAQAGTRTKTSILYVQKGRPKRPVAVFMGVCTDLGFEVSSRKGVQIKVPDGQNQLPEMFETYRERRKRVGDVPRVLRTIPSCVTVPETSVLRGSWTANHYSAARFEAIASISASDAFDLVPLGELVEFFSDSRKAELWKEGTAYVSVLHILGEGFVDVGGALNNAPKTPGIPVEVGEVLVSRINPRIPRVCVVPDLGSRILCSGEFEVMRTKSPFDVYAAAYLLQTDVVQSQIRSLTSGTSASHNRIRTSDLADVLVPIPKKGTKESKKLDGMVREYRLALQTMAASAGQLAAIRAQDQELFAGESFGGLATQGH